MDARMESRLEELENRLAFQDDLIESLNEIIVRQDRDLVRLEQVVKVLDKKVNDLGDSGAMPGSSSDHEVPPHY